MELGFTYEELGHPASPGNVRLPNMPSYIEAEIPSDRVKQIVDFLAGAMPAPQTKPAVAAQ